MRIEKELYNLRKEDLEQIMILLNQPYMRDINEKYIKKIQMKSNELYNLLTDIVSFIDLEYNL